MVIERSSFIKNLRVADSVGVSMPSAFAGKSRSTSFLIRHGIHMNTDLFNTALIVAGGMGVSDAITALKHENVYILAVCDLYEDCLEGAESCWGGDIFTTRDYAKVLEDSDIDAVIIGSPDNWHKKINIDALKQDKHVYCENPLVHLVEEGQEVIKALGKSDKILMAVSQGLSSCGNEKARELFESGVLEEINYAEGFWVRNCPIGAWQFPIPSDASAQNVEWERFVQPTRNIIFDKERFFRWYIYTDYGIGMSGDLFAYLVSSLQIINNSLGINRVEASGGFQYWKGGRDVPDALLGMFEYRHAEQYLAFNLSFGCNFVDGTSGSTFLKIVESKGSMDFGWDYVLLRQNDQARMEDSYTQEKVNEVEAAQEDRKKILCPIKTHFKAKNGYKGAHYDHFANFFQAIPIGGTVAQDPVFGFRAAAPALLCNDSCRKTSLLSGVH